MFSAKKDSLFESGSRNSDSKSKASGATNTNAFINGAAKVSAETKSGNNALKYSTTGNAFVDQFAKLGSYKVERSFSDISTDMSTLWAINPFFCVCFTLYIRLITRIVSLFDGTKTSTVQRGAGLKHEGIMRMIWLHIYHPETFWKNINLFISIGSWRDVFEMLRYDLQYNGWEGKQLDWQKFKTLILAGLENPQTTNLVKKYLPQIKAKSACTTIETQANTMIGKLIASALFNDKKHISYKLYRQLKVSGNAHKWQQLISKRLMDQLNFDTVHGRALMLMVSSKFITNNGLEAKYEEWISKKPVARFTGFVHELFQKVQGIKKFQMDTINAQFMGLVETAKKDVVDFTNLIVVRDTSNSMSAIASGTKASCGDVAKSLALFFSYMLPKGAFANSWIEFNSAAQLKNWQGSTPFEKYVNDTSVYVGGTNFQSVIDLFVRLKKEGVPESEFPSGILCISDAEFNPASLNQTNIDEALRKLFLAEFSHEYISNFKIILWNLQSNFYGKGTGEKFETYGNVKNVYYFGGFDGATIAFLTGIKGQTSTPQTAEELFNAAMQQEFCNLVEV